MRYFIFHRLLNGFAVLAGVVLVIFFLFTVLPADPARMMLGQRADSASVALINKDLGRDLPATEQFLLYLDDLSPLSVHSANPQSHFYLDSLKYPKAHCLYKSAGGKMLVLKTPYLRRSYQNKRNVADILVERLPDTAVLAFAAILLAIVCGISSGVLAALKKDSLADRIIMAVSISGVSIPSFFVSILAGWLFGFVLSKYTGLNMTGGWIETDPFTGEYIAWKNLILPAVVLGVRPMSIIMQLTRTSMLEVLSQDFIRTARAKGLSPFRIITKHALRNALNPVITAISGWMGSLLAGAVFIEFIFGWNGIGKLTVTALENYDLPIVMGIVLFISIVFIVLNLLSDMVNGWLDPRVRMEQS